MIPTRRDLLRALAGGPLLLVVSGGGSPQEPPRQPFERAAAVRRARRAAAPHAGCVCLAALPLRNGRGSLSNVRRCSPRRSAAAPDAVCAVSRQAARPSAAERSAPAHGEMREGSKMRRPRAAR